MRLTDLTDGEVTIVRSYATILKTLPGAFIDIKYGQICPGRRSAGIEDETIGWQLMPERGGWKL
jgi:hypothetical protein